jgi:hypothetical protein
MPITTGLREDQIIVNAIRELMGLQKLYVMEVLPDEPRVREPEGARGSSYLAIKRLNDAAQKDCERCGGSGYYDGVETNMRCPCTGLSQRATPGKGPKRKSRAESTAAIGRRVECLAK